MVVGEFNDMVIQKNLKLVPLLGSMTELEEIARELGDLVRYNLECLEDENRVERISYNDSNVIITARDDLKSVYGRGVWYYVDITKIKGYLKLIDELDLELGNRISYKLRECSRYVELPHNIAVRQVGGDFTVMDFKDLASIIIAHSEHTKNR